MQRITTGTMSQVKLNCLQLIASLKESEVSVANVAEALGALCPEISWQGRLEATKRMQTGITLFQEIAEKSIQPESISEFMPEDLNEEQRKGWYLQWLQILRAENSKRLQDQVPHLLIQETAMLSEEELRQMVERETELIALALTKEIAEAMPQGGDNEYDIRAVTLAGFPPLIVAASFYTASINGDFPEEITELPELIGAAAMAQEKMSDLMVQAQNGQGFIESLLKCVKWLLWGAAIVFSILVSIVGVVTFVSALLAGMLGFAVISLVLSFVISLGIKALSGFALMGLETLDERIEKQDARFGESNDTNTLEISDESYFIEDIEEEWGVKA